MLNNVFLFTWDEPFLLDQELKRWKDWFTTKRWKENILSFDSENFDSNKVIQAVFANSLFSSESFVIIKGLPIDNSEWHKLKVWEVEAFVNEFLNRKWNISQWCRLIFVSYKPDKRNKLFKFLKDNATIKTFDNYNTSQLSNFIKDILEPIKISSDNTKFLIASIGNELYRVNSELDKIKTYCSSKGITNVDEKMIEELTFSNTTQDAFKFFWILFKDKKRAINFIEQQKQQWTNWNMFSGLLYWWLKLYINLIDQFSQWITDKKIIEKKIGQNSFVLNRQLWYKDKIMQNQNQIINMFKSLIELDSDIKTWRKTENEFWLELKKLVNSFDN